MEINKTIIKKIGFNCFLIGIFILPTMLFFSAILILTAGIIGCLINNKKYLEDNLNRLIVFSGILIIISTLFHQINFSSSYRDILDPKLSLVGILNWIPFFWLFWAIQPYLDSIEKRRKTALFLIAGTFPVLVSGFGQYFFDWTGPLETLKGLIIWYQRPLGNHGLTGPFNNQNYAGSWFSFIWPFTIALNIEKTRNKYTRTISIIFLVAICLAIILTNSRNAWGGMILAVPLVLGSSNLYWFVPIVIFLLVILFITSFPISNGALQDNLRLIIPQKIWMEFVNKINLSRADIFLSAFNISLLNPLFGLGAASFPIIFELEKGIWRGHPHNLFLELAISYGYPATILLTTIIIIILKNSAKIVFVEKSIYDKFIFFDKAWWASIFIFLISQTVDVQYFDGRISIVFWILLAGLKAIIDEKKLNLIDKKS